MKATELRIGNYIDRNGLMEIYQINGKSHSPTVKIYDHYNQCYMANNFDLIGFNPVPLTEEWLLKFGFKAESNYSNYILNGIEITSSLRIVATNERKCFWLDGEIPESWKISLDHVHQLQNLYFALTGEELSLQEKL